MPEFDPKHAGLSLPKQFLVTRDHLELGNSWRTEQLAEYYVYSAPGVGVTRIMSARGTVQCKAIILGWFAYEGTFYPNEAAEEIQIDEPLEDIYPRLTGRFVMLQQQGGRLLCTTDPGAQLPVVYRAESAELGSSPTVLEWTGKLALDPSAAVAFRRADRTVWFPFGATPFAGIERLLPGQTLELSSGGAQLADVLIPTVKPVGVEQMHNMTREFVQALGREADSMECHLTAGWDSRMVLSATLQSKSQVNYVTYLPSGATARVDSQVARRIAQRFDLDHRVIPVQSPSPEEIEQWLARTSHCIRDSVVALTRTVVNTYSGRYALAGVGGEVGRAFYWSSGDMDRNHLTAEELLARLGFENSERALARADQWLTRYAGLSRPSILDRAYIDVRLGCWAGAALGGHPVLKPTLSPFNNHTIYESMLALPQDYRLSGQFARDFISCGSSKLAQIPVNRPAGLQRLRNLPRELARKLPKSTTALIKNKLLLNSTA
ncbi:MAG: hypothetical protein ABJK25_08710 [Halieaceae bacterium]